MNWYPTPSYLVKRQVILDYLKGLQAREILEVGCGCGDLLHRLEQEGYSGLGIDISPEAVAFAERLLTTSRITVACRTPEEIDRRFDVVIASEVMEHHQDDLEFMQGLGERLRPNGYLLLTVPAHMKDWGPNDDFCGHVRRYERPELFEKLVRAGYEKIDIFSYGVPVCNIMKPLYDRAIGRKEQTTSQREKTTNSSGMWVLPAASRLFGLLFNDLTMFPFYQLQRLFYTSDLGLGYFAAARKKEST